MGRGTMARLAANEGEHDRFALRAVQEHADLMSQGFSRDQAIQIMAYPLRKRFRLDSIEALQSIYILLTYNHHRQAGGVARDILDRMAARIAEQSCISPDEATARVYDAFEYSR